MWAGGYRADERGFVVVENQKKHAPEFMNMQKFKVVSICINMKQIESRSTVLLRYEHVA